MAGDWAANPVAPAHETSRSRACGSAFGVQLALVRDERMSVAEARREGHVLRDACDRCRMRKLRCPGISSDAARSRIGRPRKSPFEVAGTRPESPARRKLMHLSDARAVHDSRVDARRDGICCAPNLYTGDVDCGEPAWGWTRKAFRARQDLPVPLRITASVKDTPVDERMPPLTPSVRLPMLLNAMPSPPHTPGNAPRKLSLLSAADLFGSGEESHGSEAGSAADVRLVAQPAEPRAAPALNAVHPEPAPPSVGCGGDVSGDTRGNGNPSLSDLSLAAFLESLYTLEIAPTDKPTPSIFEGLQQPHAATGAAPSGNLAPLASLAQDPVAPNVAASHDASYAESAILQEHLAYSVPSDMRWWNMAWALPDDGAAANGSCPPRGARSSVPHAEPARGSSALPSGHPDALHKESPACPPSGCGKSVAQPACAAEWSALSSAPPPARTSHPPAVPAEARDGAAAGAAAMQNSPATDVFGERTQLPEKVHCVPNPSGEGCTCLCESDVALLSLQQSLRAEREPGALRNDKRPLSESASSSLVFTLSMSQAISRQCTCSTDCPTCKENPTYELSASLLISTALQIYARALQIMRKVLIAQRTSQCAHDGGACAGGDCALAHGRAPDGSIIDVRIGGFYPSPSNAHKIALYAVRLELLDLERALARVQSAAQNSFLGSGALQAPRVGAMRAPPRAPGDESLAKLRLNPIDQLVIRKLHQQLNEVIRTVESLELNDARRCAS
ncbi:hypothetical protein MSPP1_002690 [Malassezia sp. CBS 17886]|nr:hypothetical protein MSPP1_002690 [Malassezia sp. CBS 17886]